MLEAFQHNILQQQLFSRRDLLLVAVSGGLDSVVLCELCHLSGFSFRIAHCNFQLRGEESERDELFVHRLAEKYGVEIYARRFDTEMYADKEKLGIQEAARKLRYDWFTGILDGTWPLPGTQAGEAKPGPLPTFILTAHHADDNAETVLMNFCRGTGLQGLTGIPAANGRIRRPLLPFSRKEIEAFAAEKKLTFVEDSSNLSVKYTRNLFRNEILPLIAVQYPQVRENLGDNIARFREINALYQLAVSGLKKKLCRPKGKELHIPVRQLLAFQNRALVFEMIREYGFSEKQVNEVIRLADSPSGKYISSPSGQYHLIRHRHWFIISPVSSLENSVHVIDKGKKNLECGAGLVRLDIMPVPPAQPPQSADTACVDLRQVEFPLLLRKWKQGDYFYPLGMKKKKKLARFLMDQKLSKPEKDNTWVIESNKRIVWVVGQRLDERFKLMPDTRNTLRIRLTRGN